jgi:hypothetical protein
MRTIVSFFFVVVLSVSSVFSQSQQVFSWDLAVDKHHYCPECGNIFLDSNQKHINNVLGIFAKETRVVSDSTVTESFRSYFKDPQTTDLNHESAKLLIALSQKDSIEVLTEKIRQILKNNTYFPAVLPPPKVNQTAQPSSLLDSCLTRAKNLLSNEKAEVQIAYAVKTFKGIIYSGIRTKEYSKEDAYVLQALERGKTIDAAKKYAAKKMKKEEKQKS